MMEDFFVERVLIKIAVFFQLKCADRADDHDLSFIETQMFRTFRELGREGGAGGGYGVFTINTFLYQ